MTRCASAAGDARFSRSGGARAISAESRSFGRVDLACSASQTPLSPPQHFHCESFPACRYRRSLPSTLCTESAHPALRGTDRVDPTPGRAATTLLQTAMDHDFSKMNLCICTGPNSCVCVGAGSCSVSLGSPQLADASATVPLRVPLSSWRPETSPAAAEPASRGEERRIGNRAATRPASPARTDQHGPDKLTLDSLPRTVLVGRPLEPKLRRRPRQQLQLQRRRKQLPLRPVLLGML